MAELRELTTDEIRECEGCSTLLHPDECHYDVEGCALCDECWADLQVEQCGAATAKGTRCPNVAKYVRLTVPVCGNHQFTKRLVRWVSDGERHDD